MTILIRGLAAWAFLILAVTAIVAGVASVTGYDVGRGVTVYGWDAFRRVCPFIAVVLVATTVAAVPLAAVIFRILTGKWR